MLKSLTNKLYLSKSGKEIKLNTILNNKLRSIYIEDIENLSEDYEFDEEVSVINVYNQIFVFDFDPQNNNFVLNEEVIKNISCGRNIIIDDDFKHSSVIDIKFN